MSSPGYVNGSWLPQIPGLDLTIWVDGASMPNPGPSGVGLLVLARGQSSSWLFGCVDSIGFAGNNQAEFLGLQRALDIVRAVRPRKALILSDSMVALRLLTTKRSALGTANRDLQRASQAWLRGSRTTSLCWVPRNRNLAHHLAQAAAQLPAGTHDVRPIGQLQQALAQAS